MGNERSWIRPFYPLSTPVSGEKIFYTLDGSETQRPFITLLLPIVLSRSTTLKPLPWEQEATGECNRSHILKFLKTEIKLNTSYASQYSAGGDLALIDFVRGVKIFVPAVGRVMKGVDLDAS